MTKNHMRTLIGSAVILLGVVIVLFLSGKNATQKMLEGHNMWGVAVVRADGNNGLSDLDPVVYVHCEGGKIWMGDMNLKYEDFDNKEANLQVKYLSNDKVLISEIKDGNPVEQEGRFVIKEKTESGFVLATDKYAENSDQEIQLKVFKY